MVLEGTRTRLGQFAHVQLWQKLPRNIRRAALLRTAALLAPKPSTGCFSPGPVFVAGLLRTASGLGEGARLSYLALSYCGQDVRGTDLSKGLGQESDTLELFRYVDGRGIAGHGTILLHINSPFVALALLQLGRKFIKGKRIVGYWAWELPKAPKEWLLGVPLVHEIWVPSHFTAEAIRPIAAGRVVRVVPHPVAVCPPVSESPRNENNANTFTVLNIFNMASGLARKNPFAAIRVFQKAFGGDRSARFIIHVSHADHYPKGHSELLKATMASPNIELMTGTLGPRDLGRLYNAADVFISLHRSEGFGLTLAEAMLRGIPVLATNWSGNVDYLSSSNGVPIKYSVVPACDPQGSYHHPDLVWAEPDVEDAAQKLWNLREDVSLRRSLGQRAAEDAARLFSPAAYFARIKQALSLPNHL